MDVCRPWASHLMRRSHRANIISWRCSRQGLATTAVLPDRCPPTSIYVHWPYCSKVICHLVVIPPEFTFAPAGPTDHALLAIRQICPYCDLYPCRENPSGKYGLKFVVEDDAS